MWRCELTSVVTSPRSKPQAASWAGIVCSGVCSGSSNGSTRFMWSRSIPVSKRKRPLPCSIRTLYTGIRAGSPGTFHISCVCSITIEPLSRSETFIAASSALERLAHRDELPRPARAKLVDLLRRVVVDPAAGLHPEPALVDQLADRRRNLAGGREVAVQVRADGVVDVEARHVEQLHRADHGELVADPPAVDEVEALAEDRVEDPVLDEAGDLFLDHRVVADPPHERRGHVDRRLRGPL